MGEGVVLVGWVGMLADGGWHFGGWCKYIGQVLSGDSDVDRMIQW